MCLPVDSLQFVLSTIAAGQLELCYKQQGLLHRQVRQQVVILSHIRTERIIT